MMRIDKRTLLTALLATVAALALVGPANASAASWKDGGVTVTKDFSIGLAGSEIFEIGEGNGMNCEIKMTMGQTSGVTKVTKWEEKTCGGAFGTLAKCSIQSAEAIGLPWTATVNATNITVASIHVKRVFKTGCATKESNVTVTSTKFTPNSTTAITEFEDLGEATGYKSFGSYTIEAPNSGTTGIG